MIIKRDFTRTEHDDFVLNVEKHIGKNEAAVPIYNPEKKEELEILAWKIQPKYE